MNNNRKLIITIDGPAGVGKSTVSKALAKSFKYKYIDSGAIYRAITWKVLSEDLDVECEEKINSLVDKIDIRYTEDNRILIDNQDITSQIRTHKVTKYVSTVASYKHVRDRVVQLLRELASNRGVVMEGRDIGNVVLPDADFKFYLDATLQERAKRRYKELHKKDKDVELYKVQLEIKARDTKDMSRDISSLVYSDDMVYIDTTVLSIRQVISIIKKNIAKVINRDKLSFFANPFYYIAYKVLYWFYFKYLSLQVYGLENIPVTGGVLIVANHLSFLDPPAVGVTMNRQISYIARAELFNVNIWLRLCLKLGNAFPIRRDGIDIDVFKRIVTLLDDGKICLLFPEGTRSKTGKLQPGKPGVGMVIWLAVKYGIRFKVIPCRIIGSDKALPIDAKWIKKAQLKLIYGKPIDFSDLLNVNSKHHKEMYKNIVNRIMQHIGMLS
jgi:cytidylate kinase